MNQGRIPIVRNGPGRDVLKVWLYAAAVVVLAAWISPLVYNAGKALSEVAGVKPTNGFLNWLGKRCGEAEFPEFFLATMGILGVLLFLPFSEWLDLKAHRNDRTLGQPLRSNRRRALEGCTGFFLASGLLLLTGYGMVGAGAFVWTGFPAGEWKWFCETLPWLVIGVGIQEWLLRGVSLGIFLRAMRPGMAIFVMALLSVALLALRVPAGINVPDPDGEGIGFAFLKLIGSRLADPQVGVVEALPVFAMACGLGYARWRTASLWLPMGLHLGWSLAEVLFAKAAKPVPQSDSVAKLLTGGDLTQGLIPLAAAIVTCALVYFLTQQPEEGDEAA